MDRFKQVRKNTEVDIQILIKKYFIENFLSLLSRSSYQSKFIWKGGFVLSAIAGIEKRTTVDIDTLVTGVTLDEPHLSAMIHDVIDGKENNGVIYELIGVQQIQDEKEYAGYRVILKARLDNMTDKFHLDIATGESLIPSQISFRYQPIIKNDEPFDLFIYRPERMLAEKLQTILERGPVNTRSKDFFDVYLYSELEIIDLTILKEAFAQVISERQSEEEFSEWEEIIESISGSSAMASRWNKYQRENAYVGEVTFEMTIESITKWLNNL
jgi:predicted nucleotidyltransferase component of viral defense system